MSLQEGNYQLETSYYNKLTKFPKFCFRFIGLPIDRGQKLSKLEKMHLIFSLISISLMLLMQFGFIFLEAQTHKEMSESVIFINYFFLGLGKISSMIYNRAKLLQCDKEISDICPNAVLELKEAKTLHLRKYCIVENCLKNYFYFVLAIYSSFPLLQTIYEFWTQSYATLHSSLQLWYPVDIQKSILLYAISFALEIYNGSTIGMTVLATDLSLFSSLSLICLHFEILAKEILALKPAEDPEKSVQQLKTIARKHKRLLKLVRDLNNIYTPSIIFCFFSESFIICFVSFLMLYDLPFIFVVKTFFLLVHESKQVVTTCYFGNMLIEASSQIFNALYMHNWYEGSKTYKHMVRFMLMNTVSPVRLRINGIADISLITLQRVFSMSYQIFTLLKSSQ